MHAFARSSLLGALLLLASSPGAAQYQGLSLPAPPNGPGGEDSIETAGGTRCRQSINSNGAYLDVGVAGAASKPLNTDVNDQFRFYTDSRDQNALAYMRVTLPLGKKPERIDCSRIYELEISRLKAEVEMLKMAAE